MADLNTLLESYYEEIDPASRLQVLNEYLAAAGDSDPAASYRKELYEFRHVDPRDPSRKLDRFLMTFLNFLYVYKNSRFLPGRYVKEVEVAVKDLEHDEKVHSDPQFADAFIMEVRNAAKRYFDTCKTDGYHRKFFGIAPSKADEKEKHRCLETWRMSYGLAQRMGLEDEMALYNKAISDEYRLSRVDGLSLEDAYRFYGK